MEPVEKTAATNNLISVLKWDCSPAETQSRDTETGGISAVERERTMRNLVDVQRKVERRHQRDRERQMLRVREERWMLRCQELPSHSTAALSGSAAPGHRTEQEGGGRSAGSQAHRQPDAPDAKPATGNTLHVDTRR